MITGRIISYYANNEHISEIYFYRPSYLVQKTVDILLHVTAGKLVNYVQTTIHTALTAWVAIGISLHYIKAYTTDSAFVLKTC